MTKIIPYGYLRVSSIDQVKHGGGLDSQDDAVRSYINSHRDIFDIDRTVMMSDAGLSAYSGKQLSEGELGRFMVEVEAGRVPSNSALVVYSIDRLSRQNPWVGTRLISTIIGAGIEIHSVAENQVLKSSDPVGAIMSTIYLMRANNESVIKSDRSKLGYQKRLKESIENKKVLTRQMPRWLVEQDGVYAIEPGMKKVIDFVFDSYIAGQSTGYIAAELNKKGWLYDETLWRGSYVAKLIRDERLIGSHIRYSKQIKGIKREILETIPNFYPEAVAVEKYHIANNMLTNVAENIRGRTRVTYGDTTTLKNLFNTVIKCGVCGGDTSVVQNTRAKVVDGVKKYFPYKTFLRCRNKYELRTCKQGDIRYELIERAILEHMKGLDISSLLEKPIDNRVELYSSELEQCKADELQYRTIIEQRKREGKRVRPDTANALEDVLDRIDELTGLIESHVEENFVPNFNVDLDSIADVNNVADRSLVKKGIATVAKSITYKRFTDFILVEIMYRNLNTKHVLIIDNVNSDVVSFSIEYTDEIITYTCNTFVMVYNKILKDFRLESATVYDYSLMKNFIECVSDEQSEAAKEFLLINFDTMLMNK
ncbi:TPA: recombinase family protein [Enterobacter asburiae]|nr:recombinase family protein [Enterobacter asburiae]HDR2799102.1 recombinase family protein [Enterobacter asburiae]